MNDACNCKEHRTYNKCHMFISFRHFFPSVAIFVVDQRTVDGNAKSVFYKNTEQKHSHYTDDLVRYMRWGKWTYTSDWTKKVELKLILSLRHLSSLNNLSFCFCCRRKAREPMIIMTFLLKLIGSLWVAFLNYFAHPAEVLRLSTQFLTECADISFSFPCADVRSYKFQRCYDTFFNHCF